jgi:hypothetical protein
MRITLFDKIGCTIYSYLVLESTGRMSRGSTHRYNLANKSVGDGGKSTMGIRYSHDCILRPVNCFFIFSVCKPPK